MCAQPTLAPSGAASALMKANSLGESAEEPSVEFIRFGAIRARVDERRAATRASVEHRSPRGGRARAQPCRSRRLLRFAALAHERATSPTARVARRASAREIWRTGARALWWEPGALPGGVGRAAESAGRYPRYGATFMGGAPCARRAATAGMAGGRAALATAARRLRPRAPRAVDLVARAASAAGGAGVILVRRGRGTSARVRPPLPRDSSVRDWVNQ